MDREALADEIESTFRYGGTPGIKDTRTIVTFKAF